MGRQKKVNMNLFIKLKYKDLMPKQEILKTLHICERTYTRYNIIAKKHIFNSITTDKLEKELLRLYDSTYDISQKTKIMDKIIKVWDTKHKIPEMDIGGRKKKFDFRKLLNNPVPN